jgi:hypothetical protein
VKQLSKEMREQARLALKINFMTIFMKLEMKFFMYQRINESICENNWSFKKLNRPIKERTKIQGSKILQNENHAILLRKIIQWLLKKGKKLFKKRVANLRTLFLNFFQIKHKVIKIVELFNFVHVLQFFPQTN